MGMTIEEAIELLKESKAKDLPIERVNELLREAIKDLNDIGFEIEPGDFEMHVFESTHELGHCALGVGRQTNDFLQVVGLNRFLFKEGLEDLIKNNVYHELCHFMVNREMIAAKMFVIENNEPVSKMDEHLEYLVKGQDKTGHGQVWLGYVERVNNEIHPAIKVTAHPEADVYDYYIDLNEENVKFEIYCEKCSTTIRELNYDLDQVPIGFCSDVIRMQEQNEENNFCKCNGCLKIRFIAPDAKENILREDSMRILKALFSEFGTGRKGA